MLYFTALALIGFACATAFRWPVMFCAAALIFVMCFAVRASQGFPFGSALLTAAASLVLFQLCYVLGGAVLSLRLRRVGAKKNIQA